MTLVIYELFGLEKFAGYLPQAVDKNPSTVDSPVAPTGSLEAWVVPVLCEYMGDPPRKPLKKGHFHQSGSQLYISDYGRKALEEFLEPVCVFRPVVIQGREKEMFFRFWVNKVVDCLDVEKSSMSGIVKPDSIGVVRVPVFDESKWDRSDIFRIPRDLNHVVYCSERFVEACKRAKVRGMGFGVGIFDDHAIEIA